MTRSRSNTATALIDLIKLCRPYYCLPMVWPFVLTIWFALGGNLASQIPQTVSAAVALCMVIAFGYAMNDFCDRRGDKLSGRKNPLTQGSISPKTALGFAIFLFIAGIGVSLLTHRFPFVFTLLAIAGGLAIYNLTSKKLDVFKQPAVAVLMTSMYPLAIAFTGRPVGSRSGSLIFFAAWMLLTSWAYEILKDIRDRKADARISDRPTCIQRKPASWRRIADIMLAAALLVLAGPAFTGCRLVYIAFLPLLALIVHQTLGPHPIRSKIRMIYLQYIILGIAVTADAIVYGF